MKTSELTGAQLDFWVARAEGWSVTKPPVVEFYDETKGWRAYRPSTDWATGGPLIEKYGMYLDKGTENWWASPGLNEAECLGDTPLQAICRAVVRAVYGDEVPDQ